MMDRPLVYMLNEEGQPVGRSLEAYHEPDFLSWYEHAWEPGPRSRRIAENDVDDYWVSTVFLMHDHNFSDGPPVLWETMVFAKDRPESDRYCERYTSREAAAQGHARVVGTLLAGRWPEALDSD